MSAVLIAPPGLSGVVVADTEIGDVRGEEGFYHYLYYPSRRQPTPAFRLLLDALRYRG